MRQHSFPALVIASLVLLVCLYPGQLWLASWLPGLSGHATVDPTLILLDIPLHLPFSIDLILVPGLFIVLYSMAILIFTLRSRLPVWQNLLRRLGAVFISVFIILFCVAIGSLLSWLLKDHLPAQVRNSMKSLAVNAELHLPHAGYKAIPLYGDTFSLVGLLIGIGLGIKMISKAPRLRRTTPLTPEQRMTPYQRMLQERRKETIPTLHLNGAPHDHPNGTPHKLRRYEPSHSLCHNEPLPTLQPQAVNYRPLG
jgi:hypothetical protein